MKSMMMMNPSAGRAAAVVAAAATRVIRKPSQAIARSKGAVSLQASLPMAASISVPYTECFSSSPSPSPPPPPLSSARYRWTLIPSFPSAALTTNASQHASAPSGTAASSGVAPALTHTHVGGIGLLVSRSFSSSSAQKMSPPPVSSEVADEMARCAELVRVIKADLLEADVNKDGKVDAEELKIIMKKHSAAFTDREILHLADLFYMGKGGASVSHEDFLRGVAHIMNNSSNDAREDDASEAANATAHRRTEQHNHPLGLGTCQTEFIHGKPRGVYTPEELDVKLTHVEPKTLTDRAAYAATKVVRFGFDTVSMWNFGDITKDKVLRRVIFLETVAAIPGFVAAMVRHFKSLRTFSRDGGMLQMFLDEANNERMHLLTFIRLREASTLMRVFVLLSQTFVGAGFLVLYVISPAFCHRFVGYVEEEACHTYTMIIDAVEGAEEGTEMATWRTERAPGIARAYWRLGEEGTVLDMLYAIRADEAEHRDVNHVCSGLRDGQQNPLYNPQAEFDQMLMKYVRQVMGREAVVVEPESVNDRGESSSNTNRGEKVAA